jgi:REP element-mobilizing transposase RayT
MLDDWARDARGRTLALIGDLDDRQLLGLPLATLNPLLWEIGHVAWFQEKWLLRRDRRASLRADADALYDSAAVAHDTRWDLPLPSRDATLRYMADVQTEVLERLARRPTAEDAYFTLLAIFHEDMHTEAFTYTRQTLGYPAPRLDATVSTAENSDRPWRGDVALPGGQYALGASAAEPFVFDNEKWAHPVDVRPFAMARAPVTLESGSSRDVFAVGEMRWGADGLVRWRAKLKNEIVLAVGVAVGENKVMPRTLRASAGGYCYHVLNRGNERARVFHDDDDYHGFVALLREACARVPMRLIGYCAMPNHFHLVLWPHEDGDLSLWMQWLLTTQAHGYRMRYRGSGHVWQGRFKSFPIEEDEHLLTVLRYVERNPLRAGLVGRAEEWLWSSPLKKKGSALLCRKPRSRA